MNWVRTSYTKHRWFRRQSNAHIISTAYHRVYTPEGKSWPFLSIGLYSYGDGFKISAARKDGPTKWMVECAIPDELIYELQELLNELKEDLRE